MRDCLEQSINDGGKRASDSLGAGTRLGNRDEGCECLVITGCCKKKVYLALLCTVVNVVERQPLSGSHCPTDVTGQPTIAPTSIRAAGNCTA